jgi:alcohol dehydrogenase YqhD (iron-dependent ADH family)
VKQEQFFENILHTLHKDEAGKLTKCLEEIDYKLLDCRRSLEEYDRVRSSLQMINEKLSRLGAQTLAVADDLPTRDLGEILKSRIERFKTEGKL